MATMEQLSKMAKGVMAHSVDAQLLGLIDVSLYLGMAFDEVVRVAAELNTEAGTGKVEDLSDLYEGVEDES